METKYLTPFKLLNQEPSLLGGSTPLFPAKYSKLLTLGNNLNESRKDNSIKQIYSIFENNFSIHPEYLHLSLGCSMAFFESLLVLKKYCSKIVFEIPYYEPYVAAAKLLNFNISYSQLVTQKDFSGLDKDSIACLSNPNFFTGRKLNDEQLDNLSQNFKYLLIDEVFFSSFSNQNKLSSNFFSDNVIKINSLSKSMGLSMLRFGWVHSNPIIINELKKLSLLTFTDYPTPSLRLAVQILSNYQTILKEIKQQFKEGRNLIRSHLAQFQSIQLSHPFDEGHFGSFESRLELKELCLNSKLFGLEHCWRFRIDKSIEDLNKLLIRLDIRK
jgi:aspartate/methionine/tyrosine aminotransferase